MRKRNLAARLSTLASNGVSAWRSAPFRALRPASDVSSAYEALLPAALRLQPPSLVASSALGLPVPSLQGYAFAGADLVLGDMGQASYGPVPAGLDGAYVSVVYDEDRGAIVVGTDAAGLGRLFYYGSGESWALGRSLLELADHAAAQG